jgi:pimeloyl-ACP methyl ester carboxylesterase
VLSPQQGQATDPGRHFSVLTAAPSATPLPHGKLRVPTLLVNGTHNLSTPLAWAREELALTTHGKLVVVPGAGHSVQSRAVSDAGRKAVARFLLGG